MDVPKHALNLLTLKLANIQVRLDLHIQIEEHFIYNTSKKWSHNIQLQLFISMRTPKKTSHKYLIK